MKGVKSLKKVGGVSERGNLKLSFTRAFDTSQESREKGQKKIFKEMMA